MTLLIPVIVSGAIFLTAIAGGLVLFAVKHEAGVYSRLVATQADLLTRTTQIELDFKFQVQEWKDVLLRARDPALHQKHWTAFEEREARVQAGARQLMEVLAPGEARSLVEQFMKAHAAMATRYREGHETLLRSPLDPWPADVLVRGIDRDASAHLKQARESIFAQLQDENVRIAAENDRIAAIGIGVAVLLVLAGGIVGQRTSRFIVRRLGVDPAEASVMVKAIAHGDLRTEIKLKRESAASLAAHLSAMQASLAKIVAQIRANADSVAATSARIASGNHDLADRTAIQTNILFQAAEAMRHLADTVQENVEAAQRGSALAQEAVRVADSGGEMVGRVVETMHAIKQASTRIGEIIGVIDGIAFQTNILALNAAVEAARAGAQGRGFAVVASEVRALARRSAEAAHQVKHLVDGSMGSVEQGTRLVDQAGTTMLEVVASVKELAGIIVHINESSVVQAAEVAGTAASVNAMGQSNARNGALVQESAAATDLLRAEADEMVAAVAYFSLHDKASAPA